MSKKIILICFLLFLVTKSYAQLRIGATTQLGVSTINGDENGISYNDNTQFKFSYGIGVVADIPVKYWLNVETGLVFQNLGFSQKKIAYTNDVLNVHYLNIPINARLNLSSAAAKTKFYFKLGLYGSFAVGGNVKLTSNFAPQTNSGQAPNPAEIINIKEKRKLSFGNDPSTDYAKRIDMGFNIGLGFDWKRYLFGFNIQNSLINIQPQGNRGNSIKNCAVSYYFSYLMFDKNIKKSIVAE